MDFKFFKKSVPTLIFMAVLSVVGISAFIWITFPEKKLPIYSPADVNPKLVDESVKFVRRNHKISDFKLINQNGDTITQEIYKEKIYVADFFFTRCQTICPIMTTNMAAIQDAYLNDDEIMFLSHSVTPIIDSVAVLKRYAERKGVIDGKWNLVTGDKKEIYNLARKNYFAVLDEGDGGEQDFIHTEQFILVDKDRRIRGYYDGTNKDDIQRVIEDIQLLKKEYPRK